MITASIFFNKIHDIFVRFQMNLVSFTDFWEIIKY